MNATVSFASRVSSPAKREKVSRRVSYSTLFWLFFFGSIAGFVLEGLWCVMRKGHWENHSATVWGPFCIIYGIGAVAIYLTSLLLQKRCLPVQFAAFSFAGAVVEYVCSVFQELCFGTVSWNYSSHFWNLGGRVSLKMALLWGVLGVLFMYLVFPCLSRLLSRMRGKFWRVACAGLTVFLVADFLVTSAALARWQARTANVEPTNSVAQWLDETYNDQAMEKLFPNMRFVENSLLP